MEKVLLVVLYDFVVYQLMFFILMEIVFEVVMMKIMGLIFIILFELYLGFLKVLCYINMGNLEMVGIVLVMLKDILQRIMKGK